MSMATLGLVIDHKCRRGFPECLLTTSGEPSSVNLTPGFSQKKKMSFDYNHSVNLLGTHVDSLHNGKHEGKTGTGFPATLIAYLQIPTSMWLAGSKSQENRFSTISSSVWTCR